MLFEKTFHFSSGFSLTVAEADHRLNFTVKRDDWQMILSSSDMLVHFPSGETFLQDGSLYRQGEYHLIGTRISKEETADGLLVHTCPVGTGTGAPLDRMMAHYRFEKSGENAVRITAWFGCRGALSAKSMNWMQLETDKSGIEACCGLSPDTTYAADELSHSVHFGAAALKSQNKWVMLSDCGETAWIPNVGTYENRTARCVIGAKSGRVGSQNIAIFDEAHPLSAVLSVGEGQIVPPKTAPLALPAAKAAEGKLHKLRSGRLTMAVAERSTGVSLLGISLRDFSPVRDAALLPLTRLTLLRTADQKRIEITSEQDWDYVNVTPHENSLRIYLKNPLGIPLSVSIAGSVLKPDGIAWKVRVLNASEEYSVDTVDYPGISFAGGSEDAVLFKPCDSGRIERHAFNHEERWFGHYPSGFEGVVPVLGIYEPGKAAGSGLYAAIHAPGAHRTTLSASLFRSGQGCFGFEYPSQGMGLAANSFEMNGALTVRVLDGDWYDMARIYGEYVHGHSDWCPPLGREDSPEWMRDVPMYIMDWMPNDNPDADPVPISIRPAAEAPRDNWYKKPIELADRLGLPIGYHLYNWHFIPFNNDFPFYFPVKEGLEQGVLQMKAHGIHVMPYINGRIADTRDTRGENIRFDRQFRAGSTKDPDGSMNLESYASHEPDGSLCRLAAMCPTSPAWQKIMAETVTALFRDYHMDAVYIDQVAAARINLCCDRAHPHQPGNGDWWVKAYRILMERLRNEKPAECGFTTESNAECYTDQFDGFLTWAWTTPDLVPFFPKIYAGRIAMLGRNTNGYKKNDALYCRYHIGQAVMFGQQIGWINADVADRPDQMTYLNRLCHARWDTKEFYSAGTMLRPPVVTKGNGSFVSDSSMGKDELCAADTVLTAGWRTDGKVLLALTNCADEEAEVTAEYDMQEYGAAALKDTLRYGECEMKTLCGGRVIAHLGPQSCLMIVLEDMQ